MSTATPRLGLVKETTSENYSVATVNNNSDKIDSAVGFEQCTSSTRPSSPFPGKAIAETDTGAALYSNGSSPSSGSWKYLWSPHGPVIVGAVGPAAPLRGRTTSTLAGNRFLDARKDGEAQAGFTLDFDGKQQWGPGGSTAPDTNLYRSGADTLRTDDDLYVGGALTVVGTVTGAISRGVIRYGRRDTSSTASTSSTAVGVLRVDNISVVSGRAYIINVTCHPNSSVQTDNVRVEVRGTTSGTATTSSSVLPSGQFFHKLGTAITFRFVYIAGSTATLSILLCVARDTGTGSVELLANGTRNTELWVEDMAITTDTGTDV